VNSQATNLSIFERDRTRFSMVMLLHALEQNDQRNLPVLSKSVLRSIYDHLFFSYSTRTTENGPAMSTLLILQSELRAGGGCVMKSMAACLLSVLLFTSQMAFGQTASASSSATRYSKLFTLVSGIATATKDACKTEACAQAADELAAVVADGKEKYSKGLLINETRKQFHADLDASLLKLRAALIATLPEKEQKEVASRCPTCKAQLQPVQSEECSLCDEVLHTTLEICALYLPFNQVAALICFSAAAIAYGRCIEDFCQTDGHPSN
jgi:hypothetical protein